MGRQARRARTLCTASLVAGCAALSGEPRLPREAATVPPSLAPGSTLAATLAVLDQAPEGDAKVSLEELRLLRVSVEPWQPVEADEARRERGKLAVVAHRACRLRRGLRRQTAERTSWFVLEGGGLEAYEHTDFGVDCATTHRYRPAPPADVETERHLRRWAAQRYPGARITPEERLRMGPALVEVGRLDEAEAILEGGERVIGDLKRQRVLLAREEDAAERAALDDRIEELRALRSVLRRALLEARAGASTPVS